MNPNTYNEKICALIKEIRIQKGIKQEVIAIAIGKNQCTYSRMESGAIVITPAELKMICMQLEVSHLKIIAMVDEMNGCGNNFKFASNSQFVTRFISYFEEDIHRAYSEEDLLKEAFSYFQKRLYSDCQDKGKLDFKFPS